MPVIASATGPLPQPLIKSYTNTGPDDTNTFTLAAETGNNDSICQSTYDTGPGQLGTFAVAVSHPAGVVDHPVKLSWSCFNEAGGWLAGDEDSTPPAIVTTTEQTLTMDMPPAPVNTATRRIYIRAAADPPTIVPTITRRNLYTDPRGLNITRWEARNSWSLALTTGLNPPPVPTLTTGVYTQCTVAGAVTLAGLNMYGAPHNAAPPAAGFPVVAGDVLTISGYVYSYKSGNVQVDVKAFLGSSWVGSRWGGTPVYVAGYTWTRVELVYTVPATANRLCMSFTMPASTTWAVGDRFYVAAVMLEKNAPATHEYFDGTNMGDNPPPGYTAWEGAADNSTSVLYNDVQQIRKLSVSSDLLAAAAAAEDLVGAALERNLRRSVAEIFNTGPVRIAAGTPGLLAGTLTYLCADWIQAQALDALHQIDGTLTIGGAEAGDLAGLQYVAVERTRITAERATPGRPCKWLVAIEIREQE